MFTWSWWKMLIQTDDVVRTVYDLNWALEGGGGGHRMSEVYHGTKGLVDPVNLLTKSLTLWFRLRGHVVTVHSVVHVCLQKLPGTRQQRGFFLVKSKCVCLFFFYVILIKTLGIAGSRPSVKKKNNFLNSDNDVGKGLFCFFYFGAFREMCLSLSHRYIFAQRMFCEETGGGKKKVTCGICELHGHFQNAVLAYRTWTRMDWLARRAMNCGSQ